MIVDPETGARFVNEMADRKKLADEILKAGHPCIGIADEQAIKNSGWKLNKSLKRNIVRKFDTLTELATYYDIPIKTLTESIKRYNQSIDCKVDQDFDKLIPDNADKLEHPPYYGVRLWPKVHYTMGGLRINRDAQVIDEDKKPIKGLYAAGEVVGGVHGANRLGSCAVIECLVFGRIAGRNAGK
ncbi:FAD-binding protein [Haloplasma contractile]|uniref:Flavocytochrome c flavin subunit protein n=1 Tax=Haloplasma contractile SSD-17B TaxID=1033810 RepID=U2EBY6_9MOLU|nr:FAD-binding protein [Haloplasma contractile]ERJ12311.1 Flavocytochrome c flavin subunit protein [Haloplasma contractile SSD-17B]